MSPRLIRLFAPLLSFLGLSGLSGAAPGCAAPAQSPAGVEAQATPAALRPDDANLRGPLLWEVQGKSGPSYMLGTIHAGFRADELPPWVWDKLASCRTFVMETDISAVNPLEVTGMELLPEGQSLEQMLGKKDFDQLVGLVGLPATTVARLQPWVAYSAVLQRLYPTPEPLDQSLRVRAQTQGKALVFLESWKFQLRLLAQTVDLDDLRHIVDPHSEERAKLAALVGAYRDGNFAKVSALALDPADVARHPLRHVRMLDQRNRAWLATLGPALDRGRTFVAVGAGHFAGTHGLIELLRARGYIVARRVTP